MKLIESASQKKGAVVVFTFDSGVTLTRYRDGREWITLAGGRRSAVANYWNKLHAKMNVAILKGI